MCDHDHDWGSFTDELIAAGLWLQTGVPGVFGRSAEFEKVALGFEAIVTQASELQNAQRIYFPPVMNRNTLADTGYMQSFPDLCGSIHSFTGNEREHVGLLESVEAHEDWSPHLTQTQVALVPAACYPLYPTLADSTLDENQLFDLSSYVFRHEPSPDPARLQIFRMKENVCIGTPSHVSTWREAQMQQGVELFESLGLDVSLEVANDPFFGRGGKMLAKNQSAAELKFEITIQLFPDRNATAIASFNYHEDKFGQAFDIRTADGVHAHTACLGFGLERVTLALFKVYGMNLADWPAGVREQLSI